MIATGILLLAMASIPDTPSAVQAQHKVVGTYPSRTIALPPRPKDRFFSFGDQQNWLHPNKRSQVFFWVSHAAGAAAMGVAVSRHQTSREELHSELPAVMAVTGLDYLIFRAMSPAMSIEGGFYQAIHYSMSAAK